MKNVFPRLIAIILSITILTLSGCAIATDNLRSAFDQMRSFLGLGTRERYEPLPWWEVEEEDVDLGPLGHLRGRLEGNVYWSDFADLVFAPPQYWVSISSERDKFEREGVDLVSRGPEGSYSSVTIKLLSANRLLDWEGYLAYRLAQMQEDGFAGATFESATLGLYEYYATTIQTPEGHRRYYLRSVGGYTVSVILEAPELSELEALVVSFA